MQSLSRVREILNAIVCPACYGQLTLKETPGQETVVLRMNAPAVVCTACARRYPVEDGIPVLIESRAIQATASNTPAETSK